MAAIVRKPFETPEETRPFVEDMGRVDLVSTEDGSLVGRAVYQPGWQWSKHVKPIVGTDSCQSHHVGYVLSGRMKVVANEGETEEIRPGDFIDIQPGHDAWVVGDEPVVILDWVGFVVYAKPT